MNLKIFCKAQGIVNRTQQQPTDWEEIFINSTSDRGLVSKIYKECKKLESRKPNNPIKKLGTELIKEFSGTEESQMAEKHLKKYLTSSIIREMQIKRNLRFFLTQTRMAKIKNSGNSRCW
jgi:hypothetical protein